MIKDIIHNQGDLDKLVEKLQGNKNHKRIFTTIERWIQKPMIQINEAEKIKKK
jgi:hypothetical protein